MSTTPQDRDLTGVTFQLQDGQNHHHYTVIGRSAPMPGRDSDDFWYFVYDDGSLMSLPGDFICKNIVKKQTFSPIPSEKLDSLITKGKQDAKELDKVIGSQFKPDTSGFLYKKE